jgi:hypothetical protein
VPREKQEKPVNEEKVLGVLAEKPMKIHALLKRVSSSGSEEELHLLLMRMRASGKVSFNINSGLWRAEG